MVMGSIQVENQKPSVQIDVYVGRKRNNAKIARTDSGAHTGEKTIMQKSPVQTGMQVRAKKK